jgi:hypothetical protein
MSCQKRAVTVHQHDPSMEASYAMPTSVTVPLIVNQPQEVRPPLGNISNRQLPTRGGLVWSSESIEKPRYSARSTASEFQNQEIVHELRPAPVDVSRPLPATGASAVVAASSPTNDDANGPSTDLNTVSISPGAVAVLQRAFEYADAVKRRPDDPRVFAAVAALFVSERKRDKARKWHERAVKLDPDLGDSWARWYALELDARKEDGREDVKRRCVAADPNHGELWCAVSKAMPNRRKSTAEHLEMAARNVLEAMQKLN